MAKTAQRWQFHAFALLMTVVFGLTCSLRVLLWALTHPLSWFSNKKRTAPDCLSDPSLGNHEYMAANGVKFHYVVKGERTKPLMLMLHGFPEFWFSWRHQLREFSRDYRVIAIDMRGYGDSQRPPHKKDYTFSKLTTDVVELISQFGYAKCTLVVHDWGGVVGWRVVQRHPEVVDNFIVMNCPHPKVYGKTIAKSWKQLYKSWYIFMFQLPKLPELMMSIYDYDSLNTMFTKPPSGAITKGAFPPDVIEAYKYTFSQPGALTAPINYYRCMFSNVKEDEDRKAREQQQREVTGKIEVPILVIWGDSDAALENSMAEGAKEYANNITIKHIPNCSHWVQQDQPELVNQYMREFLQEQEQKRFSEESY